MCINPSDVSFEKKSTNIYCLFELYQALYGQVQIYFAFVLTTHCHHYVHSAEEETEFTSCHNDVKHLMIDSKFHLFPISLTK